MMIKIARTVLVACLALFVYIGCKKALTEPTPIPDPPPVEEVNPHRYGRPILSGPFFATDPTRYGVFATPGNIEVVADGSSAEPRADKTRKVIASPDDLLGTGHLSMDTVQPQSALTAIFFGIGGECSAANIDTPTVNKLLPVARAKSRELAIPILFYCDNSNYYNPDMIVKLLEPGDWAGINAYPRDRNETPADILARVRATLDGMDPSIPVAIIRPFYDGGTRLWPMSLIMDLQVPLTDLIREYPRIKADLWFAWGRPSGVVTHPELEKVAQQLDKAARSGQ